jgi:hypothetical protein
MHWYQPRHSAPKTKRRKKGEMRTPPSSLPFRKHRGKYTHVESKYQRRFKRAPDHQCTAMYDGTPQARASRSIVHALGPRSSGRGPKSCGFTIRGHVQVLHDHVDAEGERGHVPEEAVGSCCYTFYVRREMWTESECEGGREWRTRQGERPSVDWCANFW